ncbi:MAG: hypothetical protein ACKVOH_05985, partial [Chlamydiales bacterium]
LQGSTAGADDARAYSLPSQAAAAIAMLMEQGIIPRPLAEPRSPPRAASPAAPAAAEPRAAQSAVALPTYSDRDTAGKAVPVGGICLIADRPDFVYLGCGSDRLIGLRLEESGLPGTTSRGGEATQFVFHCYPGTDDANIVLSPERHLTAVQLEVVKKQDSFKCAPIASADRLTDTGLAPTHDRKQMVLRYEEHVKTVEIVVEPREGCVHWNNETGSFAYTIGGRPLNLPVQLADCFPGSPRQPDAAAAASLSPAPRDLPPAPPTSPEDARLVAVPRYSRAELAEKFLLEWTFAVNSAQTEVYIKSDEGTITISAERFTERDGVWTYKEGSIVMDSRENIQRVYRVAS